MLTWLRGTGWPRIVCGEGLIREGRPLSTPVNLCSGGEALRVIVEAILGVDLGPLLVDVVGVIVINEEKMTVVSDSSVIE